MEWSEDASEHLEAMAKEEPSPRFYVKARHVLAFMGFMMMFNLLSIRNNLSVAIVAMVNSTGGNESTNVSNICPNQGASTNTSETFGEFNWDTAQQGLVLGSYFYGFIFSSIPGGYLAKRVGVRLVVGISMVISSLLTIFSPMAAKASFELLVIFRVLIGFMQGGIPSALYSAWSKWAPPIERSNLIAITLAGSSVGLFLMLPICGALAENLGWESVFYVTGGVGLAFSIAFVVLVHDSPEKHPRISEQEKNYILDSIGPSPEKTEDIKIRTPWLAILTSAPVWAMFVAHFASNWGNYTLTSMLPTYLSSVLGFDLTTSGGLSSLPYISQFLFTIVGGYITDAVLRRHIANIGVLRKINTSVGLIGPGIFLVAAGYIGCDTAAAVAFLTLSVGLSGLSVPGCKSNSIDLAPNYNGIIYGISNTLSNLAGFLAPQVAGIMLVDDNSLKQWQAVFWVSTIIYTAGALFYVIFASGIEQPWSRGTYSKSKQSIKGDLGLEADPYEVQITHL